MAEQKNELILGSYLVLFLDVLGQRERLRELRHLPRTKEEYLKTEELLRDTMGYVLRLRKIFRDNFEAFVRSSGVLGSEEAEWTKKMQKIKQSAPKLRGFSDSFIAFAALRNDDENLTPAVGLFYALSCACTAMSVSLASKRPLRGGIDVGLGMEIASEEVYGPALERAYNLESCVAEHPRVVIGGEMWAYVSFLSAQDASTCSGRLVREIVRKIRGLIIQDSDGKRILDYLGPEVVSMSLPDSPTVLVKPGYQFVLEQERHFHEIGNEKLSARYAKVRYYFEERLPLWGLSGEIQQTSAPI